MSSILGNIAGFREDANFNHQDHRNFMNTPIPQFSRDELAHMKQGGVVYHLGWTWRGAFGSQRSIRVGPFFTADEGEAEFLTELHEAGYRLPKWWEMSRWGEKRLSKDRRKVIAEIEAREAK